jgi:hypothetical protein
MDFVATHGHNDAQRLVDQVNWPFNHHHFKPMKEMVQESFFEAVPGLKSPVFRIQFLEIEKT